VAVLSVFKQHDKQFEIFAVVVCALVALFNTMIGISCIRIRDVMESYIEKASLFSEDFGERSGKPSRPILASLGSFSIALGYAVMMWVTAAVAIVLPLTAYGFSVFNSMPFLMTLSGIGGWLLIPTDGAPLKRDEGAPRNGMMAPPDSEMIPPPCNGIIPPG
jgi:hypothetical protein